jgi:hypothetical protein
MEAEGFMVCEACEGTSEYVSRGREQGVVDQVEDMVYAGGFVGGVGGAESGFLRWGGRGKQRAERSVELSSFRRAASPGGLEVACDSNINSGVGGGEGL